jgi:DHA3 family macrolide efflux protein-like MFS transporter
MEFSRQGVAEWKALFRAPGFRFVFVSMVISFIGSGLNFAGVSWYVLEQTGSTVNVSWVVILHTTPGLIIPALGGVLIDRVDRRYLNIGLDLVRGAVVLATAALLYFGHAGLGLVYAMILLLGVGFALYWATMNALVQEVVPVGQLIGANAAALIAIQGGMMAAGTLVGFVYEGMGISGILALDGASYMVSALLLARMRKGYRSPRATARPPTRDAALLLETEERAVLPTVFEPGVVQAFVRDLKEGFRYLAAQPRVLALGITWACMLAGAISSHVLVVALAWDVLGAGAKGYGALEAGWALGAVTGGLAAGLLVAHFRPWRLLVLALAVLTVGHTLLPYFAWLSLVVGLMVLFGSCRAVAGVLTQSSIMSIVPRQLMGRTQSTFGLLSTLMQVLMSFVLGWLAQRLGLPVGFAVLGLLYSVALVAAFYVRGAGTAPAAEPAG